MSLWTRIAGLARRKDAFSGENGTIPGMWSDWGLSTAGMAVNSYTALAHTIVMACTSILSEDVAKLRPDVWRRLPNGGKESAKEHWLYRLLRRPNAWQTRFEFFEMMQAALVLRGNAFAAIVRDLRGVPQYLVPLHPDRVSMYEAPGGEIFYWVTRMGLHEMAVLKTEPILVPAEDMFHLRWMAAWNSLMGISRIQMMRETIGLSISQERMASQFAGSGARPGGVLQTDRKLTKEVIDRIKAVWQETQASVRNAGKTAVLEEGLKWQALGMTMQDAEFIASRQFSAADIARGFRVPRYKLGLDEGGPGSSVVQLEQDYLNSVISSYCERWTDKLDSVFLDSDDDGDLFTEFDYSRLIQADVPTRLGAGRVAIIGTVKTPNEVRRSEGLADVDGGDILFRPANMVPIDTPVAATPAGGVGSDTSGAPAPGGDGDAGRLPGD